MGKERAPPFHCRHISHTQNQPNILARSVAYGLVTSSIVGVLDAKANVTWNRLVGDDGKFCIPSPQRGAYHFFRLRSRRRLERPLPMQVHFKGGISPRILGVVQTEE